MMKYDPRQITASPADIAHAMPHEAEASANATKVRWMVVSLLFTVTTINYADRAALAIAGPAITSDLGLNAAQMGLVFSAFSWSYTLCQIPGGWALDRYGSKTVYAASIFLWSFFTLLQGFVGLLTGGVAVAALFALRFLVGAAEAPSIPGNSRIVSAWFPSHERATASAIFNSAQYFATVIFVPIMGWLIHAMGWSSMFIVMGILGICLLTVWPKLIDSPASHRWANRAEVDHIRNGGGLVDMDATKSGPKADAGKNWDYVRQLFASRMMVGIFIGQYCISVITWFFLTWFPVYLVQARGMSILNAGLLASLPALCGFFGGNLGGIFSDWLLKRGHSLSIARKVPIVLGMLLSVAMIGCNYTDSLAVVVTLMALAFFGKGFGALGWAVLADTAPRQITGLAGSVFNTCGNLSGIVTPLAIGFIIQNSGSFNGALVFVGVNALLAALSFVLITGEIKRMELKT